MRYAWFAKSLRVLLAAIVLAGSLGTSATYGHSHVRGTVDHTHHAADHDDHSGHDDKHLPSQNDEGPIAAFAAESAYHLHAALFGISFVVPSSAHLGRAASQSLAGDLCPAQYSSLDVERLLKVKERIPWPLLLAFPPVPQDTARRPDASRRTELSGSAEPWTGALGRSVILLC